MLDDKDVAGVVEPLAALTEYWIAVTADSPRAIDAQVLATRVAERVRWVLRNCRFHASGNRTGERTCAPTRACSGYRLFLYCRCGFGYTRRAGDMNMDRALKERIIGATVLVLVCRACRPCISRRTEQQ